jgi:eukaryotic-like serine/threonine-protein kinase
LRILIIDDHRDYRMWLGHHVAAARPRALIFGHDPGDGSALPPGFDPARWDLVFLDHRIGEHDGIALLRELKARPNCPPIVQLTPQGDEQAAIHALAAGADDYLPKDKVPHGHIERVIREALRRGRRAPPPARPAGAAEAHPPFRLRGHRFLKELGGGSTASVYLMEESRNERLVVVKVFRQVPERVQRHAPLQRFLREYEIIAGIRHPNVVRIHDLGMDDDMAFIVMEYFAGGHLGERMADALSMDEALEYLAQIGAALDAIHSAGVLHRDLKPANIMLREDGTLALIDFGVARLMDAASELTGRGEIFGTPYYMSPEQGEGAPADARADLYSLGIVFYELLTGRKPYVAATPMAVIYKHRHAPLPALPPPLEACQPLLDRLLAKRPADRFGSAAELLEAVASLRGAVSGTPPATATTGAGD